MTEHDKSGEIKIQPPAVKLVAAMPEDEHMEEKIEDMKKHDGYTDYCQE